MRLSLKVVAWKRSMKGAMAGSFHRAPYLWSYLWSSISQQK